MDPAILSVATAVPAHSFSQEEAAEKMITHLKLDPEKSAFLRKLYKNSAIVTRYSVIDDFKKDHHEWHFWGADFPKTVPGISERNNRYKKEAPQLAYAAAFKAIEKWGGKPSDITHIVYVSCTGLVAPGIEFNLTQMLKLDSAVNRLGINFMGCFGAFKGLSVAKAFALENPRHRILVVCTELCSLHFQADLNPETLVANALFADGAAAVIVGRDPKVHERPLWTLTKSSSSCLDKTEDKMGWDVSEKGFLIRLSRSVPVHIGRSIKEFVNQLLPETLKLDDCGWAIHPGGKSILQAIEKAFSIDKGKTKASWEVLEKYGNMSSATFLFILEHLLQEKNLPLHTIGMAFGPGLSIEGVLLTKGGV